MSSGGSDRRGIATPGSDKTRRPDDKKGRYRPFLLAVMTSDQLRESVPGICSVLPICTALPLMRFSARNWSTVVS